VSKSYSVYPGIFPCKTCKENVGSMRVWKESGLSSWRCKEGHISEVQLAPIKKTKRDYEREEREQETRG